MSSSPVPMPDLFYRTRNGNFAPCALLAAGQLDLFTALKDGPRTIAQLARAIGAKPDKLRILLNVLVLAGLLERHGETVANTPESQHFLAHGSPGYVGEWWRLDQDLWQALLKTAATLRTGEPQSWHDFMAMSEAEMTEFFAGLHGVAVTTGSRIAATENFAAAHHLLDVGGGSGGVAIGACQAAPALRATVLDLPRVIPFATSYIARAGLTDRIGTCVADITRELPPDVFDLAELRAVIQVLAAGRKRRPAACQAGNVPRRSRSHCRPCAGRIAHGSSACRSLQHGLSQRLSRWRGVHGRRAPHLALRSRVYRYRYPTWHNGGWRHAHRRAQAPVSGAWRQSEGRAHL